MTAQGSSGLRQGRVPNFTPEDLAAYRNAVVRIRKGPETQELKWKKAEALVRDEGWEVAEVLSE